MTQEISASPSAGCMCRNSQPTEKRTLFCCVCAWGYLHALFFFKRGKINTDWAEVGWDERHLKEFGEEKGYDM